MPRTLTRAAAALRSAVQPTAADADLLARFLADRDEDAFAALVDRHGPMVLGVCRRALGLGPDADDAFQATFLVLLRQARSKAWRPSLGPWLYGVAVRVARKARSRRARRPAPEPPADAMPASHDPSPESRELLAAFDAELAALPELFRRPLVLCELQGLPRAEAARRLGVSEGTLSSRLARGRRRLRDRLARRGLAPALVATTAVPAKLRSATVGVAKAVLDGAAGAVPAGVAVLTEGVVKAMILSRWKVMAGFVVAAVAATALAGGAGDPPKAEPSPKPAAAVPPNPMPPPAAAAPVPDVVATVFGDTDLTRQEFGEYLIRKYGQKEIEPFVNLRMLTIECARRGVVVTPDEVRQAYEAEIKGFNISRDEFAGKVLSKYGKSESQWLEECVQPRIMAEKLWKDRVRVTDEDLRRAFVTKFGERRKVRLIVWPKGTDRKRVDAARERILTEAELFADLAHRQSNPALAAAGGELPTLGRYGTDEDEPLRAAVFALKREFEITPVVEQPDGSLVLAQLVAVVQLDPTAHFHAERPGLLVELTQEKLRREIPRYFAELKKEARPQYRIKPAER